MIARGRHRENRLTAPSVALVDIGSTLVSGPSQGPAARISERLGLTKQQRASLQAALMTRPFRTPQAVLAYMGETLGELSAAREAIEAVWHEQEHDARALPGAAETLQGLHGHGLRLGLVSNIWEPYFRSVRRHFGPFFDAHIPPELQLLSFQVGQAKPSPRIFQAALAAAAVPVAEVVMIGDSYEKDIEPAAALGMRTIWVLHRPDNETGAAARVRGGAAPAPSCTVGSIAEVTAQLIASDLSQPRGGTVRARLVG